MLACNGSKVYTTGILAKRQSKKNTSQKEGMSDHNLTVPVTVRYRDIDSVGHVNNAVYVTYLEHARTEYISEVMDVEPVDPGFVIASLDIDYLRPITYGDDVNVGISVTDVGESSILMEYDAVSNGEPAASATTVMVPFDEAEATALAVPESWRSGISAHEGIEF